MLVLQISAAMFLAIIAGWWLRRRGVIGGEAIAGMSRLLVEVTFPALVFVQLLRTVSPATLAERWQVPLFGAAVVAMSAGVGAAAAALGRLGPRRPTFTFLVATPNWIFLPLPIAEGLFGDDGVQVVLLANVGAQVALWTLGVWILRGGRLDRAALRGLAMNPGLVATAAGLLVALLLPPPARWLMQAPLSEAGLQLLGWAALRALDLLASMTVPLSLLITGAQLGAAVRGGGAEIGALAAVALLRLVAAPLAVAGALLVARPLGIALDPVAAAVVVLIAAMPAAVSCGPFAARFGGDVSLAARAVFATTLLGLATVPLVAVLLGL